MHVVTHLSKLIECTTPRVDPKVSYGLWMILMCLWRFISCNKCTIPGTSLVAQRLRLDLLMQGTWVWSPVGDWLRVPRASGQLSPFLLCAVLSHVWLFVIPRTAAQQAALPMGLLRQENWSGLPFSPLGDLFLIQGSNSHLPSLLHHRQILNPLSHPASPSPWAITTEVWMPIARAPQQERPQTQEAHAAQQSVACAWH